MFKDVDLKSLIEMLDPTDISVVQLKTNEFELLLSRESLAGLGGLSGGLTLNRISEATAPSREPLPEPERTAPLQTPAPGRVAEPTGGGTVASPTVVSAAASLSDLGSLSIVESPLVGIFYHASSPGAPPYVEVGQQVEPDTTVGLLETMKVFTAVQAGRRGVVREILAENGHLVENGDPLVAIEEI